MADVVSLKSVGCAYRNGRRMPGWGVISLDDGRKLYCREAENSFDAMCARAELLGHTVSRMRARLDHWVETGQFI
jgi:hypothetical protein